MTMCDDFLTAFFQEEYDTLRPLSYPGAVRAIQGFKGFVFSKKGHFQYKPPNPQKGISAAQEILGCIKR